MKERRQSIQSHACTGKITEQMKWIKAMLWNQHRWMYVWTYMSSGMALSQPKEMQTWYSDLTQEPLAIYFLMYDYSILQTS